MIEVRNLSFSYGRHRVLEDISFTVQDGEILAVMGMNGSGKSTLISAIDRLRRPESGDVLIDGVPVSGMDRKAIAARIAYLPQRCEAAHLSVFDAVLLGRKPYMGFSAGKEDVSICRDIIHRMRLDHLMFRDLDELSGGELQKVLLARSLVQEPRVMLLDEPTSNLDPHNQYWMMSAVRNMASEKGIAVLAVLHDLNLAMAYADKLLFLKNGRSCCLCTPDKVDSALLKEVYAVNADIAEADGRRFAIIRKEFTL